MGNVMQILKMFFLKAQQFWYVTSIFLVVGLFFVDFYP